MLAMRLDGPGAVDLPAFPTEPGEGWNKDAAGKRFADLAEELGRLQELLYAAGTHALLVILQGRDAAGKDGALRSVAGAMNPVGARVVSFKAPTATEIGHDFLWRVHAVTPGRGEAVLFNRSHYEDILVARVHTLVPPTVWARRYDHINAFERLLSDEGVIVAKFFLNVSREEQERRLLAREAKAEKAWKLAASDWVDREHWDEYTTAYEDALGRCSAPHAPWFVVPADRKWFRDVVIAEALVETLRPYEAGWRATLDALGAKRRAELEALRETHRAARRGPDSPTPAEAAAAVAADGAAHSTSGDGPADGNVTGDESPAVAPRT